jgi:glutaredoxin 3
MVTVYTTEFCPYCVRAKELLRRRQVSFKEIMISMEDDDAWDALFKVSGMQTVPQIFHKDRLIGGYDALAALDRQDELNSLKSE